MNVSDFTLNNPYFWLVASFFVSAGLSWLLTSRPRKWWVLVAALVASYFLFALGGLAGFLAALAVRLLRAQKSEPERKKGRRRR